MEDCVVFFFFLPLTSLYQQRASAASEAPAGVNISSRGSLPILILPCLKQSPGQGPISYSAYVTQITTERAGERERAKE